MEGPQEGEVGVRVSPVPRGLSSLRSGSVKRSQVDRPAHPTPPIPSHPTNPSCALGGCGGPIRLFIPGSRRGFGIVPEGPQGCVGEGQGTAGS